MPSQVARVEEVGELAAAVLAVGAEVGFELGQGREFGVLGRVLVRVGGLDGDADCVVIIRCGF